MAPSAMDNEHDHDHECVADVAPLDTHGRRSKRGRDRKRKRKYNGDTTRADNEMNKDAEKDGNMDSGNEETKHQHREHQYHQADHQQQLLSRPLSGLLKMIMALKITAPQRRQYREVALYGTARAVVGPGYAVRELLFDDETVSFRITVSISQDQLAVLRREPANGELAETVRDAMNLVEHYKIETVVSMATTNPVTTTTSFSVIVHLTNRERVPQFRKTIESLAAVVSELNVEPVNARSLVETAPRPSVTKTEHTHELRVSHMGDWPCDWKCTSQVSHANRCK